MSKSQKTYELEEIITLAIARDGRVGCPEVTLGDYGIVDFVSMDLKEPRTVRCYELKITKSDFLSNAKKTFIGDFNYYVIPSELWLDIKGYVEPEIGVWLVDPHGRVIVKKEARKLKCKLNRSYVLTKILKALNRENLKHCESQWINRQIHKKIADKSGGALAVGDIVEYRDIPYKIIEIEYEREQMSLVPMITLSGINRLTGEEMDDYIKEKVKPTFVRKLPIDAVLALKKGKQ